MKSVCILGLVLAFGFAATGCSTVGNFLAAESARDVTPTPTPSGSDWGGGGGNSTGTSVGAGGMGR